MKFFDPARPRLDKYTPCYASARGRLTPLPHITVFPEPDGSWYCTVWVPSAGQGSKEFSFRCASATTQSVQALLDAYMEDPEWALAHYFGYEGPQASLVGASIDPELLGL